MTQNETILKITRLTSYSDRLRSYKIVVDGREMGFIKAGETVRVLVEPGNRRVYLKIDWCSSNIIDLAVKAQTEYKLECGSRLTGLRIFLAYLYITFWRHKYLWIRLVN